MNTVQLAEIYNRNLTESQRRSAVTTHTGVVIESTRPNLAGVCNSMIISRDTQLPTRINEREGQKSGVRSLLPVAGVSLGVMGLLAGITGYMWHNAKIRTNLKAGEFIPDFPRNMAINDEMHQAVVRMVISPAKKTLLAGAGVLVLSTMAFMGKTFAEGFRDVWMKKREADIQKGLQERLIDIETQSFGGKIQIIRNMLSEKSNELACYLGDGPCSSKTSFGARRGSQERENSDNNVAYAALGLGTLAAIVGLGYLSMRNLSKSKAHFEKLAEKMTETVKYDPVKGPVGVAHGAMGGGDVAKPVFYSHVNDYRAFCYNWLLNTNNKQFKMMFFGIAGLAALGYGGKLAGEAVRDFEVKKINADTEVALQNRLVSTELRNFKAKKDAAIEPLVEEFHRQMSSGKPKEELSVMAENILCEVKNGPPFVYA